jgi:hypothetical protein
MSVEKKEGRSPIIREHAADYLLISLVAFGITVVFCRVFLHITGYPQIGNDVLHIAHALWGGLLLFVAVLLLMMLSNRWVIKTSALLSGIGIGLFIDEVGKFITQTNDYFFPPALSLIYGFFILNVFIFLHFRRPHQKDPRKAMYHAFEGLEEALDGDLDTEEAARIEAHLAIAKQSDRDEIVSLADSVNHYLQQERHRLLLATPSLWRRIVMWVDAFGLRFRRRNHRILISALLLLWVVFVIGYIAVMVLGSANLDTQVLQWRGVLIIIQSIIGGLMIIAAITWLAGNEERGLKFSIWGILLSLVALQLLYFYISQLSAITSVLFQFIILMILLSYRRWYLTFVA